MRRTFGWMVESPVQPLLVLTLAGLGAWMLRLGAADRALGEAPEAALADLAAHAGAGPVVVRAHAVAVPPLAAPGGERLALQTVLLSHDETDDEGRTETLTDYDRVAPEAIWAGEGDLAVKLETRGIDRRWIPVLAEGRTGDGGSLPAAAASLVAPSFTELPGRDGLDVEVRGIADSAPVTIHAAVEMEAGAPVLRAPGGGRPLVVTPLPWDEVTAEAREAGTVLAWIGWIVVGLGAALFLWLCRSHRRRTAPAAA